MFERQSFTGVVRFLTMREAGVKCFPSNPVLTPADTSAWRQAVVDRQTVSIMKACEMVGVSRRTIYNWIAAEKVEYVRTAGGSIRIFVDTLWRQPDGTQRFVSSTPAA